MSAACSPSPPTGIAARGSAGHVVGGARERDRLGVGDEALAVHGDPIDVPEVAEAARVGPLVDTLPNPIVSNTRWTSGS